MKFRVHFEASAAVGIEIEVEANDEDEARNLAAEQFGEGRIGMFEVLVDELVKPSEIALAGYVKAADEGKGLPVTYVTVELDENGFEIVDTFELKEENP